MPDHRQDEFATNNDATRSIWMAAGKIASRGPLVGDVRADVCIVGAGIAGLTIAYRMAKPGRKIVVLDDGPIAGGESCRTTAHLARKSLRSAGTFAHENLKVAGHYAEHATKSDVDQISDIMPGEGAVMRQGLRKLALYRDPSGQLHVLSAACPHLGCIVHWNSGEKSWDCPCHGSRFHALGEVVNGPANTGLAKAELGSERRSGAAQ